MPVPHLSHLKVEHYESGLGVSEAKPRLSWRFEAEDIKDWTQRSCDVTITREGKSEDYHVDSADSIYVPWPSSPLRSREIADVSVKVTGSDGSASEATKLRVEAGLLERSDWKADMIGGELQTATEGKAPVRLRSRFKAPSSKQARLYITAHGLYEAYLNGKRIGDEYLAPGWTTYFANLRYAVHDVTDLLQEGENTLSAWIAEGWFCGQVGPFGEKHNFYGDNFGLLAQLEIDGQVVCATGTDWEWSYGGLKLSEIYNGESFDSNIDDEKWKIYQDGSDGWQKAIAQSFPKATLMTSPAPPVRIFDKVKGKNIITTPSGKTIIDFGQNFAGWLQFVNEPPTRSGEIVLRHAEVLEHGELGTRPLRQAKATDTIILGGKLKGWRPTFTFHGFRYVEVTGWDSITPADLEGVALSSDMERTGDFQCSHEMINKLYSNVYWSTRANAISLPTDCPQRAERLGWTGDIQVFAPTMGYMFNSSGFLAGWLKDLWAEQDTWDHKIVPLVIPDIIPRHMTKPQAIWSDVSVLLPWDQYIIFGDKTVLADQYESVQAWLATGVERDELGMWREDLKQFADWLAPASPPGSPAVGPTDNRLVANAYLVHTTRIAGRIAAVLGKTADAKKYEADTKRLLSNFHDLYVTRRSRVVSDTQTALGLILHFDLIDPDVPDQRTILSKRLAELVAKDGWMVSTGFAGTPIILFALAQNGSLQDAYRMLQAKNSPSWLAPIFLGATTIWERWDSMLQDGSINPGRMTSFNHYALGSVAAFLHSVVGGLSLIDPGWKKFSVKPQPGGSITSAETSFVSPYGKIGCSWQVTEGKMSARIVVPPNTTAVIELPGMKAEEVGSGVHDYSVTYKPHGEWPPKVPEGEWILEPLKLEWV